jgi:serine/threonine protein kinase
LSLPDLPIGSPLEPQSAKAGCAPVRDGDVLADKYRVDHVLGVGGMGVVVAATHLILEQPVALKFMLASASEDEELVERFLREARAMARLRGEHVVRVLDVGKLANGAPYMVMDYLEGRDLRTVLASGFRVAVREAIDYIVQACDAVAEAHERGIVHRDLKPHNLFLTAGPNGRACIKVLDFGISKSTSDKTMTRAAAVVGSPHYMAPEQLLTPSGVDGRADIWALGVCLYQLLTKRSPFEGAGFLELRDKILNEPPVSPETYRPDLPFELVQVVRCCLEKSPDRRYQKATDLSAALQDLREAPTRSFSPYSVPSTIAPVAMRSEEAKRSEPAEQAEPRSGGAVRGGARASRVTMLALGLLLVVAGVAIGQVTSRRGASAAAGPQQAMGLPDRGAPVLPETSATGLGPEPRPPATGVPREGLAPPELSVDGAANASGALRASKPAL